MTLAPDSQNAVQPAQSPARPALVMLTTGTAHAAGIIEALNGRGRRPAAVILEQPAGRALLARVREATGRRGVRSVLRAIARRLRARLRPSAEPWRRPTFYSDLADRVISVPSLTGGQVLEELRRLQPDLIVLGGAPILPDRILDTARLGVLNAHPGWLPEYRGVDVVAHAVLGGGPIGATVHYVDTGIDTGRIVTRIPVEPIPGQGLEDLQRRVENAGGVALAGAADRLLRDGSVPTEEHAGRHPLCRRLTDDRRAAAEAILRSRQ